MYDVCGSVTFNLYYNMILLNLRWQKCPNPCVFLQVTSGGIIMLQDVSESPDGPEELIEPLKGR